jgi:hypothetical protein
MSINRSIQMKKLIAILVLAFLVGTVDAMAARQRVIGPGLNSGRTVFFQTENNLTLYADTVYTLTGIYFVPTGKKLTIQPGTVIMGDTAAVLVVQPGGKIYANGTAASPIVFTSRKAPGLKSPGDWGGIILLGSAPTNQVNPQIEGGIIPGTYGGSVANDSSGVMRYVRIEYPGYRYQLDNEVNGLTMGGVGSRTVIDYIQVSYSFDDSYEWFGGTVNAKHLVAIGGTDDEFDTDFGYQGKVQFAFGMKDKNRFDPTGQTNGFESDNEASASYNVPRTRPSFSNITLVGPLTSDVDTTVPPGSETRHQYVVVSRRGTQQSIYNSILMGYRGGYSLRDQPSYVSAIGDTLQARNISLQANPGTTYPVMNGQGSGVTNALVSAWFNTAGYNNYGGLAPRLPSSIGLTNLSSLSTVNPVPAVGSEPDTAATDFSLPSLSDPFFDNTATYRGAFDPAVSWENQWTAGWTNFDPQNTQYYQVDPTWNLISLARVPSTFDAATLLPGAVPGSVNGTLPSIYTLATTLTNGEGYWAQFTTPKTLSLNGTDLATASVVVPTANRWVLVGSTSSTKPLSSLTSSVPGSIVAVWGWNGSSYVTPTQIEPMKAYWVFVNAACTLTIN